MITSLSIENFALIEKLNINFSDSFSIITGETGAGKSILLGALGLALGKRADSSSLKDKEKKCIIEVTFTIANYNINSFFEDNDLDYDAETIIRREILPNGKSRAFINDSPVTLQQLQDLSLHLIDIHSQNQTLELAEEEYQFKIVDSIAENGSFLKEYQLLFKKFRELQKSIEHKKKELSQLIKEKEYSDFLYNELMEASIKPNEYEELEQQNKLISNVEFIKENFEKSTLIALEENFGIQTNLKEFKNLLQKNASFDATYQQYYERANSISIELDDLIQEISKTSDTIQFDSENSEKINQRLILLYNLQKKHQVLTTEELLNIQEELEKKVNSFSALEEEIASDESKYIEVENELNTIATRISTNREKAIPVLIEKLMELLAQLGMQNVRFKLELVPSTDFLKNGKENLTFLISANKGTSFELLKKVASGGEMSRIMLSIKSLLSQYTLLPTIIFDEIDTGVSGEIANKMAHIMSEMSHRMQVFAITHLPQIAAKGKQHYKVYKKVENDKTVSDLVLLNPEERILEIAEMLSGKNISESAINHAKVLLH